MYEGTHERGKYTGYQSQINGYIPGIASVRSHTSGLARPNEHIDLHHEGSIPEKRGSCQCDESVARCLAAAVEPLL
ncbi:hypothetical protein PISMIDRAFT_675107, partial [Pisolithus microcarpus 441]